jgi:hypothetical protein
MTVSVPRRLAVAAAWLAAVAGAIVLFSLSSGVAGAMLTRSSWLLAFGAVVIDVAVYVSVGAVLALRRPGNVIGPVLMAGGCLIVTTFLGFVVGATATAAHGPDDPIAGWASLIGGTTIYLAIIVAGPALAMLVPDGHLPGPRWRWPVLLIAVMYVAGIALTLGQPGQLGESLGTNPLGDLGLPWSPAGAALAAATLPLALVTAVAAVVVRFRRARSIERQQLKWFVTANVVFAVLMLASFLDGATEPTVFDIGAFVSLSFPPLAIGIAVLRYRLYEIDRIISRTLGWAIVTGILVAVFAGLVVGLQALLAGFTQGQTLAVAGSTLVAFALFQPVRRRVQRAVDRRFDRARYDGERTAAAFAARLRGEVDLDAAQAALASTAAGALQPSSSAVWLRRGAAR